MKIITNLTDEIVTQYLRETEVTGDRMENIIKEVGMEDQMVKQLYHDKQEALKDSINLNPLQKGCIIAIVDDNIKVDLVQQEEGESDEEYNDTIEDMIAEYNQRWYTAMYLDEELIPKLQTQLNKISTK